MNMRFFDSSHLRQELKEIACPIQDVAKLMDKLLPSNAEKSAGMRKLLEAKDCFVRAALPED